MRSKEDKAKYDKQYYQQNRSSRDLATKLWFELHPGQKKNYQKIHKMRTKHEAFAHYGFECACCGDDHPEFLSIDHIGGGGSKHRKSIKGSSIYSWLKRNGYPDGFRTLCFNCNCSIGFFGYCPHEMMRATGSNDVGEWQRFKR